jgi:hypothetical protein
MRKTWREREQCEAPRELLCSLGGGGGGGSQSVTQEFKPPEYTKEGWQQYLNAAGVISQRPYEQSGLPQVAPWNEYQDTAARLMFDKTLSGTPMGNAANGAFTNAAQGNYANPYAQNVQGIASGQAYNPAMAGYAEMAQGGTNPFTEQMIANNTQNMAEAYSTGTAAQNDMSAAMSGAFGGSAHELQQQAGAANLAKQVGQMATGARQSQYQNDFGNRLQALGGYANTYQGDVGNQLNANAQAGGMWQNDIGNILQGAHGGLAGDAQYNADMQGLMGAGNSMNNYVQQLLGQYNNQWATQQGYDAAQNDAFGNALGRASGSYGGTTQVSPGMSQLGGLLGLGAGAAGMYSLFKP